MSSKVDKVKGWLWGTRRRRLLFVGVLLALPWLVGYPASSAMEGPQTAPFLLGVVIIISVAVFVGVVALGLFVLVIAGWYLVTWIRTGSTEETEEH